MAGGQGENEAVRGRRPYRPLIVLLVLLGIFCVYAASDGWHLSCHLLDAKCVRVIGLNFGQSITANAQSVQSDTSTTDTGTDTTNYTSTTDTNTTSTSTIPAQSPGNPIRVDCYLNRGGCFWAVGPGTGAEQNAPPDPKPGATYSYDYGASCTWRDDGQNDLHAVEMYTCQ